MLFWAWGAWNIPNLYSLCYSGHGERGTYPTYIVCVILGMGSVGTYPTYIVCVILGMGSVGTYPTYIVHPKSCFSQYVRPSVHPSVRPSVGTSVRPSVTFSFRTVTWKRHCCIFSKLCRYVHHVMGVCCIVFDIDGMLFEKICFNFCHVTG